jgi:probable rRNA maturation factor
VALSVSVQYAAAGDRLPPRQAISRWVRHALREVGRRDGEVTVRLVDEAEGRALNRAWRGRDRATNVLSFPAGELPVPVESPPLGDIVVCVPVVEREAAAAGKPGEAHWAHLVVHGALHLAGFDHETAAEAAEMEALESRLLAALGLPDPWAG